MELMLEVISRQKFNLGKAASHVFGEVGGLVGRGDECEWSLPDKSKQLSRKHALISCDGTAFYLEDLSTNGIYSTLGKERILKGRRHKIEHGESFLFGEYTVQARLLHKPDAYLSASMDSREGSMLIPDDAFLDMDPLRAMEQQEEFEAKSRLGDYSELLGGFTQTQSIQPPDHNEPSIDSMLRISAVQEAIPGDWAFLGPEQQAATQNTDGKIHPPQSSAGIRTRSHPQAPQQMPADTAFTDLPDTHEVIRQPETDAFFTALGFSEPPEDPTERERILKLAGDLLMASVEGLLQSLRNRADSKNDFRLPVTTMTLASNNPLKFSPNGKAALEYLLGEEQEGMLPPVQAILASFNDLHSHHMGILAGARAAVAAALHQISPDTVEARLDASGQGRLNRSKKLWQTFIREYTKLIGDQKGFAPFFLQDFARAYEVQIRTLHPLPYSSRGEK